jgi:hypothetical protein
LEEILFLMQQNQAKLSPEVEIQYGKDDFADAAVNVAPAPKADENSMMMEMMKTMQQMQKELAALKGDAPKKAVRSKKTTA